MLICSRLEPHTQRVHAVFLKLMLIFMKSPVKPLLLLSLSVVLGACNSVPDQSATFKSTESVQLKRPDNCQPNLDMDRLAIPPTPNNMPLPAYGQGVIGWGTGPEGAQQKLQTVSKADVANYQRVGVTLEMLGLWQKFYENETRRNPCNPTAPLRAELMKKIASLW